MANKVYYLTMQDSAAENNDDSLRTNFYSLN